MADLRRARYTRVQPGTVHTVPEQELNISKKMIILEAWTFYLLKTIGKLLLFGIFKASSILDFTKSRPCLIMHVDSVEKRLCPN